jgi:hypothetical protein
MTGNMPRPCRKSKPMTCATAQAIDMRTKKQFLDMLELAGLH